MTERKRGFITHLDVGRSFCFVGDYSKRGKAALFAHCTEFDAAEWQQITMGACVEFTQGKDRDNRPCAKRATLIDTTAPAIGPVPNYL